MTNTTTIPASDLFEHYFCDPIGVAEWIVDQRLKIVGILDDLSKTKSKKWFFSELEEAKSQAFDQQITRELQVLLRSRSNLVKKVNEGSGASFELIDQIPEIEDKIRSVLSIVIFNRNNFEELFQSGKKKPLTKTGGSKRALPLPVCRMTTIAQNYARSLILIS